MLYKPSQGIFKDNCVFFHEGRYYLFSMYSALDGNHDDRNGYNHVWQAVSDDGVHWRDAGPVISAPFLVWAMGVWQAGNRFYLNHGSFSGAGTQNVLRFWESPDLRNWTYMGEDADLSPDPRWYDPESRFDCMDVISTEENGRTCYHGIASGPGGWLRSDDGVRWEGRPPSRFEFGSLQPAGDYPFEIAGWLPIDGKIYVLGSRPVYAGNRGYCVYTLTGASVNGPFRPDAGAYRLSGHTGQVRPSLGETLPHRKGGPRQQLHVRRLGVPHGGRLAAPAQALLHRRRRPPQARVLAAERSAQGEAPRRRRHPPAGVSGCPGQSPAGLSRR